MQVNSKIEYLSFKSNGKKIFFFRKGKVILAKEILKLFRQNVLIHTPYLPDSDQHFIIQLYRRLSQLLDIRKTQGQMQILPRNGHYRSGKSCQVKVKN